MRGGGGEQALPVALDQGGGPLLIDADHLPAIAHHAGLDRGAAIPRDQYPIGSQVGAGQLFEQEVAAGVRARHPHQGDLEPQPQQVPRHIGRTARGPRLPFQIDNRYGRLRRDPLNPSPQKAVQHQVADHDDLAGGHATEELGGCDRHRVKSNPRTDVWPEGAKRSELRLSSMRCWTGP